MRVQCEVRYITLEGDHGNDIDSVEIECGECGYETESYGDSDASIRRCLVLLREECPRGESNFYMADGD